ncbi:MAG: hypothetical protein ACI4S3_09550 [Candidatus Gastranaerophilaceae bacterium]
MNVVEVEYDDIENDIIKKFLLGKIYHITSPKYYLNILENGIKKRSQTGVEATYPEQKDSVSNIENWISLFNMFAITNTTEYRQAIAFHVKSEGYIFILKDSYKAQIIFQENLNMEQYRYKTFYPQYECWSDNNITMDKISQIIHYKG